MADPLSLDGTTIPVRVGGHGVSYAPLAPSTRAGSGQLRSAVTSDRPKLPGWEFETIPLSGSEDTNVLGELTTAGTVSAAGELLGFFEDDGGVFAAIDCYVSGVRRRAFHGGTTRWSTAFRLDPKLPVQPAETTTLFLVDDGNGFAALSDTGPDDFEWEDDGNGFAAASDSASGTTFTGYETGSGVTFIDG